MKYSFDEKLKAVKQHLENVSCLYPERCDTKDKKKTYLNWLIISEEDVDKKLSSLQCETGKKTAKNQDIE